MFIMLVHHVAVDFHYFVDSFHFLLHFMHQQFITVLVYSFYFFFLLFVFFILYMYFVVVSYFCCCSNDLTRGGSWFTIQPFITYPYFTHVDICFMF